VELFSNERSNERVILINLQEVFMYILHWKHLDESFINKIYCFTLCEAERWKQRIIKQRLCEKVFITKGDNNE
jgi:hypothetical protein